MNSPSILMRHLFGQLSVFHNGCLHIIRHFGKNSLILLVDIEENTWRTIDRPPGLHHSLHQVQSHLCSCVYVPLMVLMNPSFQSGSLKTMVLIIGHSKHSFTTWKVFGRMNIRFGYPDFYYECIVLTIEWNLIFLPGRIEQSSHMTWTYC
jgi:hypothetical protein